MSELIIKQLQQNGVGIVPLTVDEAVIVSGGTERLDTKLQAIDGQLANTIKSDNLSDYIDGDTIQLVNNKLKAVININPNFISVVPTLPESGNSNHIYLVSNNIGDNNKFSEYIWINNAWEKLGDLDLGQSITEINELNTKVEGLQTAINNINTSINNINANMVIAVDPVENSVIKVDYSIDTNALIN